MLYYLEIGVIVVYGLFMAFILLYSFSQLGLIINYSKRRKNKVTTPNMEHYPYVTIQLPVYNEKYVIERLIDAAANFNYPIDKLEIQILDDSTDETVEIVRKKVEEIKLKGFDIHQVRRKIRTGYKAGALKEGTEFCKGEFIAIFDSDFVPKPDFLEKCIPHFQDDKIGVVQTKWGHLNEGYSMLTELQAFGLNAHFTVEQGGRNEGGHFINFNGTAGIWRKKCIEDAGGWSSDTLTEDLDLSYRAQIKGWKFQYLEEVESPAELPAAMESLKAQQYRWTKGAAECARKNLGRVLKAKNLKLSTKIFAIFHLMNSFLFICIMGLALLSVPMIMIKHDLPELGVLFNFAGIFLISLVILFVFYRVSSKQNGKTLGQFLGRFPLFLSVSMGLSLYNARAVLEGYMGRKTAFIRTPKFNLVNKSDSWNSNKYIKGKINLGVIGEGVLALYFIYGIFLGIKFNDWGLMPFHAMLIFGFGSVFFYSLIHSVNIRGQKRKADKKNNDNDRKKAHQNIENKKEAQKETVLV